MSKATATHSPVRARPLSPHLQVYRWTPTMTMSILHRATGIALYFGTLLVAAWLIAASISKEAYDCVAWLYGSWFGLLVIFGYTWALLHHMLGGIRHFIWDTGAGLEKHTATKLSTANLIASVVLTMAVWAFAFFARGAL